MLYYRVKDKYDNLCINDEHFLGGGELYTEKELKQYKYIPPGVFDKVEIPKEKTYFFFGARFESKWRE